MTEEHETAFRAEVEWLLTGLAFTAGHGRFLGGRLAAVEFLPIAVGSNQLGFRIVLGRLRPSHLNGLHITLCVTTTDRSEDIEAVTDERSHIVFTGIAPEARCVVTAARWEENQTTKKSA